MDAKKIVLPALFLVLAQISGPISMAAELRPSFSYDPEFKSVIGLEQKLMNPSLRDSVLLYRGTDPFNKKGFCYVFVHRSEDPANPIYSAVLTATQKIHISSSVVSSERVEAKAIHMSWQKFIESGHANGEIESSIVHSVLFVNPQDVKADGTFVGDWKFGGAGNQELSGTVSWETDGEADTKTLTLFQSSAERGRYYSHSFHFSSKTHELLDVTFSGRSQAYRLVKGGQTVFDKSLSPKEGTIETMAGCNDLRDPRKPGHGNSADILYMTGTSLKGGGPVLED